MNRPRPRVTGEQRRSATRQMCQLYFTSAGKVHGDHAGERAHDKKEDD